MDVHDTVESELVDVIPFEGLELPDGVLVTACGLASRIENALRTAGHLTEEI